MLAGARHRAPRPFDARRGLTISHDSKLLARGVDNGFQLWDLKLMQVEANVAEPSDRSEGARMLAFSPDDKTLVSTDGRGLLLLWDVARLVPARRQ
ncbi:MAG: hypothetical protein HY293_18175 [Planctomycetes bacterium]|nr:hypothetical protein [Planctomycetota bacterium]